MNITNVTQSVDLYETFSRLNQAVSSSAGVDGKWGLLYILFMLGVFIIFYISYYKSVDTKGLLVADTFIVSILSSVGFFLGFIPLKVLIYPLILFFGSLIVYLFSSS